MAKAKPTWREKRDKDQESRIVDVPENWSKRIGEGKMVILTPKIINEYINSIPKGKLATVNLIRKTYAKEYHVDMTCPLTTGIFIWIDSNAAEEDRANGVNNTPYWRILKEGGKLNPRYPGGVQQQAHYLESEGFHILKGNTEQNWKVQDFEKYHLEE